MTKWQKFKWAAIGFMLALGDGCPWPDDGWKWCLA